MCLVNDDELEGDVHDDIVVIQEKDLVAGDENLEFIEFWGNSGTFHGDIEVIPLIILDASSARLAILVIIQNAVHVCPFLHCSLPVLESRQRSYHQERPLNVFKCVKMVQESDRLNCFSKTHLIGKNGVSSLVPWLDQPVQTFRLIRSKNFIVFVYVRLVRFVLVRFFLLTDIVEVKSIFDLCDLRIWKLGPFLRIVLYFNKNAMFLSLRIHQCSCFFSQSFVGVFELMYLLRAADDVFLLPGGLTVAQIFPLHHVEVVYFYVQVKSSHVWQVDVVVSVLHEFFSIVFIVKPVVAELSWI